MPYTTTFFRLRPFSRLRSPVPRDVVLGVALAVVALVGPLHASEVAYDGPALVATYDGPLLVDNSQLAYTGDDKLSFVTARWLDAQHPELLPLRPAIDTWASRFAVHPKVLSAVLANRYVDATVLADRADLDVVVQVASALSHVFEQQKPHPLAASRAVVAVGQALAFPLDLDPALTRPRPVGTAGTAEGSNGPPLFGYFQPPWPIGDTWAGGGAHGDTGSGVRNALDYFGEFRDWGVDVSQWWVSAMQGGTVRVWSSCGLSVIHPNGWSTDYYHLENIQVPDFATVARDAQLSNYADDINQALCQGGASTAPHVHVSVYYMDQRVEIDQSNIDFTSFSHHAGVGQYDSNCNTSWYDHVTNGQVCPWDDSLFNNAPPPGGALFMDGFESGDTSAWDGIQ